MWYTALHILVSTAMMLVSSYFLAILLLILLANIICGLGVVVVVSFSSASCSAIWKKLTRWMRILWRTSVYQSNGLHLIVDVLSPHACVIAWLSDSSFHRDLSFPHSDTQSLFISNDTGITCVSGLWRSNWYIWSAKAARFTQLGRISKMTFCFSPACQVIIYALS